MTSLGREGAREAPGGALLWFAVLGPPVFWAIHLVGSYPLALVACAAGGPWVLHLLTVATGLPTVAAILAARRIRERTAGGDETPTRRAHFMATGAVVLGPLFLFVTILEWLPVLVQDPCR